MRSLLVALFALAISLPATGAETTRVRFGSVGRTAVNWPVFVAEEEGMFKAEGLDVEVTYVGNVAHVVQQLVAGSFDIAASTFDSAIRAIAKGGSAVMIGGMTTKYPYSIMVPSSVHTLADLKGKTVILPFPKDLLTIIWNRWVSEHGMQPKDIDQIYDGATRNRFSALIVNAAQAAVVTQPYDFRAATMGYHKLVDLGAYARQFGFLAIIGNRTWLQQHPAAARSYLRAVSTATDWLYDKKNRDAAIALLVKYTKVDKPVAAQTYDYYIDDLHPFSRKAALPRDIVDNTFHTLVDIGDITPTEAKRADGKLMDLSYLPK